MPKGIYKHPIQCGFQKGHKINLGRKFGSMSDEQKKKLSLAHLGKKFSPEIKKNMSEGQKKRYNRPFYSKEWLISNYVVLGKSLQKIADETSSSPSAIRYWLIRFSIPSEGRFGKRNPRFRGYRQIHTRGYELIKAPKNHPTAQQNGYILEHRFIAEQLLGRCLRKGENVHHKNGNKANNQPSNLLIFSTNKDHSDYGGKLIHFAQRILYGDLSSKYPELRPLFEELVKDIPIVKE